MNIDCRQFLGTTAALDGNGAPRAANDDSGIEFPPTYTFSMLFTFGWVIFLTDGFQANNRLPKVPPAFSGRSDSSRQLQSDRACRADSMGQSMTTPL